MADQGKILSAVDEYADALVAEQRVKDADTIEQLSGQVDTLNVQHGQDQETIAALRARVTELEDQIDPPQKFGVASHQLTYRTSSSVYSQDAKIEAMHDHLGNAFNRDLLLMTGPGTSAPGWAECKATMKRHFDKGRTFELTVGRWADLASYDWDKAKARLMEVAPMLSGVAGINEPDDGNNGGVNFSMTKYAGFQSKLYALMKNEWTLQDIPVSCGAIRGENADWDNVNKRFIEANRPYMDQFNWHWYPLAGNANATEQQIRDEFAHKMDVIRSVWSGPVYISECGATSANVSLDKQAWIVGLLLDMCAEADVKCVIYELACDQGGGVQQNFGLFEYDGTPRPAAEVARAKAA